MSNIDTTNLNGRAIEPERVKAWANLDGTGTIALRDSLNISSVIDNGTGLYGYNLTNSLASSTSVSLTACDGMWGIVYFRSGLSTVSKIETGSVNTSGTANDTDPQMISIQGDLA